MKNVNVLALLVVVTAAILTGIGKVDPESFLLLVTGLAIPARSDGYQNVGMGAVKVEGVPGGEPVVVDDAGHADLATLCIAIVGALIAFLIVRALA